MYSFFKDASEWVYDLSINDVPSESLEHLKIMIIDTLGAIFASLATSRGINLVFEMSNNKLSREVELLPILSVLLDYDSTLLYYGHLSHGIIFSMFAHAFNQEVSGREIVEAGISASEVSARVAAALSLSRVRGQMMSIIHSLSTAIMFSKFFDAKPDVILNAMGYAFSYLIRPTREGFGTVMKSLSALTSALHGLRAYELAKIFHGNVSEGIFENLMKEWGGYVIKSPLSALGKRWHMDTLSVKKYPACSYAQTAIEATLELRNQLGIKLDYDRIRKITIMENLLTYHMDKNHEKFVNRSNTPFTVLQFYTPYLVAYSLLYGKPTPRIYEDDIINDTKIWELISKITNRHDIMLTASMLKEPLPFGVAIHELGTLKSLILFGKVSGLNFLKLLRTPGILRGYDIESIDFDKTKKIMGVKIEIVYDNNTFTVERDIIDGFHGTGTNSKKNISLLKFKDNLSLFLKEDDVNEMLNILLSLEKAKHDEIKILTANVMKVLQCVVRKASKPHEC